MSSVAPRTRSSITRRSPTLRTGTRPDQGLPRAWRELMGLLRGSRWPTWRRDRRRLRPATELASSADPEAALRCGAREAAPTARTTNRSRARRPRRLLDTSTAESEQDEDEPGRPSRTPSR
jgi:hypothetical protein